MKTTMQLRNFAINDLRERTPKLHYWMRDFSPEADREAARPLIQNFASIGLTPRELAAAEFLNAYANYEILDRELAPKARDIDDRSPIEPIPEHKAAMLSAMRMAYLEAAQHYELLIADDKFPNTVRTAVELDAGNERAEMGEAIDECREVDRSARKPVHRDLLTPLIEEAVGSTARPDTQVVFTKLREMATANRAPFKGVAIEGLKWIDSNDEAQFLSSKSLGQRLRRRYPPPV